MPTFDANDPWLNSFQVFLEAAPDAMVVVNSSGRITLINSHAQHLFGYSAAELLNREVEMLVPERYRNGHKKFRENFYALPNARSMGTGRELFGLMKDGSEFPVEISLSPIETPSGLLVSSAVRNIAERKHAEQRFRSLLESAPDAMVIVDGNGKIVLVNAQTEKLFGYDRAELLDQAVEILVPGRYRTPHVGYRDQFIAQPKVRAMGMGRELFGLRKNGTEFPVEISLSPIETHEGVLIASAIRDITLQKELEHRLQDANRMKSEFLATMSHELRTPLNGILGFTEFLSDEKPGPLTPKQKEYLNDVLNSGRHLLQIINDVLDLSKVEAGKMELNPETFAVTPVVEQVCSVLFPLAKQKNIAVKAKVSPVVEWITLDQQKFKQVLYNLISNAVKFTDDHGTVTVTVERSSAGKLTLEIQDTGIGIKPEDLSRLFIEFQQLDSSLARKHSGTGLGLVLVKKIVEFQDGSVHVVSEFGKGSIFRVELPIAGEEQHRP